MRFSVIIPVYNCADKLHISVDSILNQTFRDFELILVNDGSKDNSLKICQKYADKDSRIVVIDQPNLGPGAARNNAIRAAKGDYLVFCDADDCISPEALECAETYFRTNDWDIMFFGYSDVIIRLDQLTEIGKHVSDYKEYHSNQKFKSDYDALDNLAFTYPVWNKIYRRDFVIKNGAMFPIETNVAEDFIFNIQLYRKAENVLVSDKCFYMYIHHANSITSTFNVDKLLGIEYVYQFALKLFMDWNPMMVNKVKNSYIRDLSVFINNMYNKNVSLKLSEKRRIVKKIVHMESVQECLKNVSCMSFRNKIIAFLLKCKMTDVLLLTGKIARL